MQLLENKIPDPIRITIEKNVDRYNCRPGERTFYISFMREETCNILGKAFELIDQSIWSLDAMKITGFSFVEENRRLLSIIVAIAVYNYRGRYSKKDRRFISKHATAEDLLALIYLLKAKTAKFLIYHHIKQVNVQRLSEFLQKRFEAEREAMQFKIDNVVAEGRDQVSELFKQPFDNLRIL